MEGDRPTAQSLPRQRIAELLAKGMTRSDACRHAGVSRSTFYTWLRSSPEFRNLVRDAESRFLTYRAQAFPQATQAPEKLIAAAMPREITVPDWVATLALGLGVIALFTVLFMATGA